MTLDEERRRGNEAAQLLENPLLIEAFNTIENEVIEQWRRSPARDQEAREKLWIMQAMITKVHAHLKSVMETGMLAAATAELQSKRAAGQSTILD